jgi:hypothetical protein
MSIATSSTLFGHQRGRARIHSRSTCPAVPVHGVQDHSVFQLRTRSTKAPRGYLAGIVLQVPDPSDAVLVHAQAADQALSTPRSSTAVSAITRMTVVHSKPEAAATS